MKRIHPYFAGFVCILGCILLNFAPLKGQQDSLNPCKIEKVTIDAIGPGRPKEQVQIWRRECDQVVISKIRYAAMAEYSKQLSDSTAKYLAIVNANITLRDSIDHLKDGFIQQQDSTIAKYQGLNAQYQKLASDYNTTLEKSIDLAKDYDRKLTWQKLKSAIFTAGGVAVGVVVGVLLGKQ
jgi:hypothetical protein